LIGIQLDITQHSPPGSDGSPGVLGTGPELFLSRPNCAGTVLAFEQHLLASCSAD
jgi:hypothetical protein